MLSDGSSTYLYGLGRIARQNVVGWQYYQGDVLDSVRQLTDPVGSVTLVRSYEPFGSVLNSAGDSLTPYGYTGEWGDPTGLVFLRARYYDPAMGRFLSKDPVSGLVSLPQTLNPYTYAINNPLRYTDSSGEFVDVALDIAFIGFDIYILINHWNTSCGDITSDLLTLGLDIVGALIPFATGLGRGARLISKLDNIGNFRSIVYCGLSAIDNPSVGLFARAPGVGNSPISHVAGRIPSQWISTSKNLRVAKKFGRNGVVAIDLSKVGNEIVDLSKGIPGYEGTMISNWAKKYKEVLIKDYIPPEAIVKWMK